jgi:hypothetical protein
MSTPTPRDRLAADRPPAASAGGRHRARERLHVAPGGGRVHLQALRRHSPAQGGVGRHAAKRRRDVVHSGRVDEDRVAIFHGDVARRAGGPGSDDRQPGGGRSTGRDDKRSVRAEQRVDVGGGLETRQLWGGDVPVKPPPHAELLRQLFQLEL